MEDEYGHERTGYWEFHEVDGVEVMFWLEYEGGLSLDEQKHMINETK